jgi:hypothetical protein
MAKGGARNGAGRPIDPDSFRSLNRNEGYVTLPRVYRGECPPWPFAIGSQRERAKWLLLWQTPQAAAWHANNVWLDDIALYVRLSLQSEDGDMKAASEARQWSDRLGLNLDAMERRKWRVALPDEETPAIKRAGPSAPLETAAERLARQNPDV